MPTLKNLSDLSRYIQKSIDEEVTLDELCTPEFMKTFSTYTTIAEFFKAGGIHNVKTADNAVVDAYVKNNTPYDSLHSLAASATKLRLQKKGFTVE